MDSVVVRTGSGELQGTSEGGVSRFLGVPYAASPADSGWLLPPAPVPPWEGVRPATEYGPTVPKNAYPMPSREMLTEPVVDGDECLNLNIWSPGTDGFAPVFVWIHGGAFRNGSGIVPQYDGTAFARDGVVCVTINYRLGLYGSLDTGDGHTNIGLRDQIAALRWVQDNIAAFGGDPARVTIGGESAGGMSVTSLLASPLTEGLFRGAIAQSGAGHHATSPAGARAVSAFLADTLGIEADREAFARVPRADLLAAQEKVGIVVQTDPDPAKWGEIAANTMPFEPVVGDDVMPVLPYGGLRGGRGAAVSVLVGTNADEMLFFLAPTGIVAGVDQAGYGAVAGAVARYGFADPAAVVEAYKGGRNDSPGKVMAAVAADWFFGIPAVRVAEARADRAQADGGAAAPTYVYQFGWSSTARGGTLGSCHALEIGFVFDTLAARDGENLTGPNPPQALADEMHAAWVRFITDGAPGWEPYTPDHREVRIFDIESETVVDPRPEQRVLWEGLR
ncbi:carboxylesterase/lipase family protein [Tsukamurella soli]|uniref:Carboxylic ester hydrolase n=1 Tax=Tsukamurella soli TaxID=644556 RepID=A0ABP8K9A2_9ACTN